MHGNQPLQSYEPLAGYRYDNLTPGPRNTDDVLVCVTFSGGGVRASALAYGVLQGLRDTKIPPANGGSTPSRLLDEIDVISSVSGGSFTALGYGLERQGLFDGRFERGFLKQNVQRRLIDFLFSPLHLLMLPAVSLDRVDVAADYYDKHVFDRKTYGDLLAQGQRPLIVVNATNLASGQRFQFTQDDFDLLGSDLTSMSVGRVVAASSAFPLLFSPLRLKYYQGPEDSEGRSALRDVLSDPNADMNDRRRQLWASNLVHEDADPSSPLCHLDETKHKYLYLLDGGLVDNLGVTYFLQALRFGHIRRDLDAGKIKKLVVIVVNAANDPPGEVEDRDAAPGLFAMGLKSGHTTVYNYSSTIMDVLRFLLQEQPRAMQVVRDRVIARCPEIVDSDIFPMPDVDTYLIEVNFREIPDADERRRFLSMPTTLFLSNRDIDDLLSIGHQLLLNHPELRRLLADLGAGS